MIKSITIRDFFSFKGETKIVLNPKVNLLLGINGSGKTSFINALRVLVEGVCGDGLERLFLEKWNGFNQIVNFNGDRTAPYIQLTYEFDYDKINQVTPAANFHSNVFYRITITPTGNAYRLSERMYSEKMYSESDFVYLESHSGGNTKLSTRIESGKIDFIDYQDDNLSNTELVLRQISDSTHYLPIYALNKAVHEIAVYNSFNVDEDSNIRKPQPYSTGRRLNRNGENLTQIINDMKLLQRFQYSKIDEYLHKVNPAYEGLDVDNRFNQSNLYMHERNMSRVIEVKHISDGTLRFLLMESIMFNQNRGFLIAVDEPEKGLHPDMIRSLSEMIQYAAESSQIIIATHSPHLLNQFSLDDILIFEKDENNCSNVLRCSEDQFDDYDGELLPGLMWLNGMIGGKRW